jgi:hypothetical protein
VGGNASLAATMRSTRGRDLGGAVRIFFVLSVLWCAAAAADPCPAMSVTDAKALTRSQLEERVCKYLRTVQAALAQPASSESIAIAQHCIVRVREVEDLYEERFHGAVSKCMRKGAPELEPPKPAP